MHNLTVEEKLEELRDEGNTIDFTGLHIHNDEVNILVEDSDEVGIYIPNDNISSWISVHGTELEDALSELRDDDKKILEEEIKDNSHDTNLVIDEDENEVGLYISIDDITNWMN